LSLLDQAIAHGAGETTAAQVRAMLGLADRGRVLDLFDMILKGEAAAALTEIGAQYSDGADPMAVLRDLAEITHWISVIKITPEAADDPTVPPDERTRGQAMAAAIPMRVLSRFWQMLLKAIEEVSSAPNAMMAAEMAVIRLTHVADLPDPETLMRKIQSGPGGSAGRGPGAGGAGGGGGPTAQANPLAGATMRGMYGTPVSAVAAGGALAQAQAVPGSALERFARFEDVLDLIRRMRDIKLLTEVENCLRLARYAPGRIEFEPTPDAPRDLAATLGARLQGWTGVRWGVSVVSEGGAETIAETRTAERRAAEAEARHNPVIAAIFDAFPNAKFEDITTPEALAAEQQADALPEVEDEWDPFEDN
jgi:DNA polymerase-3 subunit gamma/tau